MKIAKLTQRMKRAILKGFTLIELLVVVAIIAVVGAGIAVTYQHMDQHAKVAMEVSDIAGIKKTIKHWSAVRDFSVIPDGFDLLVKQNGTNTGLLYGHPPFSPATAPPSVLTHLANAGVMTGYAHLNDNPAVLNDSTFTGNFDTSTTIRRLYANASNVALDLEEFFDNDHDDDALAHDYTSGPFNWSGSAGALTANWTSLTSAQSAINTWTDLNSATLVDRLAFLTTSGVGGLRVLSNLGLDPSEVALGGEDPAAALAAGKKYYLVGMGLGRFSTLYEGRAVRLDGPPKGKRFSAKNIYSRYIVLIKVPVEAPLGHGSTTGGTSEKAQIVDVLSPQGLSVAALQDNLDTERANLSADN